MTPWTASRTRRLRTRLPALLLALALGVSALGFVTSSPATAQASATPQAIASDDWLGELNLLRAIGGLWPVTEVPAWGAAGEDHSKWMVYNDFIMHGEITPPEFEPAFTSSNPWYTPQGDLAGQRSNLVLSTDQFTNVDAVDTWMTTPFHGISLIDPKLTRSGFGSFYDDGDSQMRYGAALDVGSDLAADVPRPAVDFPVVWPATGSVVHLTSYGGNEVPDPLAHPSCSGFTGPVGLPLYALFGAGGGTTSVTVERTSDSTPMELCWFDGSTYENPILQDGQRVDQNVGRQVLGIRGAVVAMPRHPLEIGEEYTFTVVRGGTTATSTFMVGEEGVGAPVQEFFDVAFSHPFYDEIAWMNDEGLSTGYEDGTYKPGATLTRMALSAFLYRFVGSPNGPDPTCDAAPFNDVAVDHPFCGEIAWMDEAGISNGYPDGSYKPSDGLTRMAMSAFLYRVAGSPLGADPICLLGPFNDVIHDHPFCGEIAWMKVTGISEGYAGNLYQPGATLTRMAMSAFLFRLDGVLDALPPS